MRKARARIFKACTALAVAGALALSGCSKASEDVEPGEVTVNGDFGSPVTLSISGKIALADRILAETLIEGNGPAIVENGPVLMRATSFDSRTGEVISDYDTGDVRMTTANEQGVGDLAGYIMDTKEGTRLLIERPGLVGDEGVEIIVVDLLPTTAVGEPVGVPDPAPAGMPQIETLDSGAPHVAAGNGRIPALATVPLIVGEGEQVGIDDTIVMQYVITDKDANLIDTTWNGVGPVTVNLSDVMQGLQEGLADQTIGSRVAVLIPSSQASGEGDRIAIVDLLAVSKHGGSPGDQAK